MRCQIAVIERTEYRSVFVTNTDAGAVTPVTPSSAIRRRPAPEEIRPDDVARLEALALRGELQPGCRASSGLGRPERVEQALQAADAELERLDRVLVRRASTARARRVARALDTLLLLLHEPAEPVSSSACFKPGVVSSVARSSPIFAESEPTSPISVM